MAAKIVKLAQPADPTIDQVLEEFLAEQRERLKPRTVSRYEDVLNLLRHQTKSVGVSRLFAAPRRPHRKAPLASDGLFAKVA
ncbi:MAG: hypothetical protein WBE26_12710 [Phycisphaerae bacterium]